MNLEEQIKNLVIAASSVDLKQRFAEWSTTIKDEIFLINDDIKEAESEFKELKGYSDTKMDDFENCFENYYAAKKRLKKLQADLDLVESFVDFAIRGGIK